MAMPESNGIEEFRKKLHAGMADDAQDISLEHVVTSTHSLPPSTVTCPAPPDNVLRLIPTGRSSLLRLMYARP